MAPPDLIAGLVWAIIAALLSRRSRSTAALAAAVSATWFVVEVLPAAVFWHRFALILLLVCAPRWLPRTWTARLILVVEFIAALTVSPWAAPLGAVLLSLAFVGAVALEQPRQGVLRWAAVVVSATSFALPVVLAPSPGLAAAVGWAYAGSLIVVGLLVLGDLGARPPDSQRLDLLVDLGATATPSSARERVVAERLLAKHEELLSALDADVAELAASRRRLAEARLTAGRELREDLDARVIAPLLALSARTDPADTPELASAREHVRTAFAEIEAISAGLGPRSLASGLPAALRELSAGCPVPVLLALDDGTEPDGDEVAALTAYLVCAEALVNAAKHARAGQVQVTLRGAPGGLVIDVVDDGIGGADPARGTGLLGIRDRVEAVGGTFELRSDASGTVLSARIPLRRGAGDRRASELSEAATR